MWTEAKEYPRTIYLEEKLPMNTAIKAKKCHQGELSQAFIDLGSDAPKEAKKMVKNN